MEKPLENHKKTMPKKPPKPPQNLRRFLNSPATCNLGALEILRANISKSPFPAFTVATEMVTPQGGDPGRKRNLCRKTQR